MKRFVRLGLGILMGLPTAAQAGSGVGHWVSRDCFQVLKALASEKQVVTDIEQANSQKMNEEALQEKWVRSTAKAAIVRPFLEKPSCHTMRDYFFSNMALMDCYTLDVKGRLVGALYKTPNFIQDQEPHFVECLNQGEGKWFIEPPTLDPEEKEKVVEISLPVLDGNRTVGVLVATVLLEQ